MWAFTSKPTETTHPETPRSLKVLLSKAEIIKHIIYVPWHVREVDFI